MDNAFERARAAYGTGAYDDATLEFLFPQLKESEDERIRKWLVGYFTRIGKSWIHREFTCEQIIAYLEKQKDLFRDDTKMVEQKPAEWSEDWREEDIQTRFAFYTYKDDPSVLYLSNVFVEETSRNHGFGTRILKAAEKAAEAIGAITICLKVKQDSPANAWYRKHGYGYIAFEGEYDWLEKNLEYLKPKRNEQPVEGLEEEIDDWYNTMGIPVTTDALKETARHFYGLRNRALEEAARHVYESWMGGTMDDVRRDMAELGKVLNARKEDK